MSDVGLVGCSKRKLPRAAPAAQLYASRLFRLASQVCSLRYNRWFILSALHGLVEPDEIIEPYDRTLQEMDSVGRQAWAAQVLAQLRQRGLFHAGHRFLLHAGADYADPLAQWLGAEQPLRGLGIGQRLAWYPCQLATPHPKEERLKNLSLPALGGRQGDRTPHWFAHRGTP